MDTLYDGKHTSQNANIVKELTPVSYNFTRPKFNHHANYHHRKSEMRV